jgi:polyribonucleotide nucleotidyltransferase
MSDFKEKTFSCDFLGKKITVKTGKLAQQVDFSCTVQYGDTVILGTVNMAKEARPGIDFFPLMVDYEEKLYAAGKIKGSRFVKREGMPTEDAVLIGRMIDRGLRPLFPASLRNDVQLVLTVLSYDESNLPGVVAIIAASIVLHCSSIPWNGPVAGIQVGRVNNEYQVNLSKEELVNSDVNLVVTANKDKVLMVDADFKNMDNNVVEGAFTKALSEVSPLIDFIEQLRKDIGKVKVEVPVEKVMIEDQEFTVEEQSSLSKQIKEYFQPMWGKYLFNIPIGSKSARKDILHEMTDLAKVELVEKNGLNAKKVDFLLSKYFMDWVEEEVTKAILDKEQRVDGRALNQIRQLEAEVGLLPRPHGSALFRRGETQILSVVTLGAPGAEQTLDTMGEDDSTKRYMHHYNFAPYSVGEIRPLRGAGRREIGHGALAEKALEPVLPAKLDFPYTIRVVSETLGSNGSSSMASTCGSSLSLMAAGVPIKEHVAGVAIGLASDGNGRYKILTDIQDLEDGKGGMDFKVTGTRHGVTAIQMDTKTDGLTMEMIKEALIQANEGRNQILDVLEGAISKPAELSKYAPRILSFSIDPEKIGEVIGPGGKIIKKIVEETKVDIDIDDDGSVFITSDNAEMANRAKEIVLSLVKVVKVGDIYEGKVSKLFDFGAMVKILPQKEGMVHISELEHFRVNNVTDIVNIGDTVKVIVKEIDHQGRVNLSRKALLPRPDHSDSK